MGYAADIIDLSSDDEAAVVEVEDVKPNILLDYHEQQLAHKTERVVENCNGTFSQKYWESNRADNPDAVGGVYEHDVLQSLAPPGSSTKMCRQFWKAGDYENKKGPDRTIRDGKNHLRVHPKFLHSNATSHKWAFGALAELLDNAVDEIGKGATFVVVDVVSNLKDGGPALLIQDDGGGMDPESLRRCMSFGFSDKYSATSIGQYGNGFKTSTMRLGADAIVFSCCTKDNGNSTQCIGLLSYTFLRLTGCDDIVVPMVDYEVNPSSGLSQRSYRHSERHFSSNLAAILKWSPWRSETDLLRQFDDIGHHGTKIMIFNLWYNDDGVLELDFDSEKTDIMISGAPKTLETRNILKKLTENHISSRLRFSLKAYLSILYLHLPEHFRITLRGEDVQPHKLATDLRYVECIKYTPNVAGNKEAVFITTIGFLEGAPNLNVNGFSIYHRNRLILPFWRVVNVSGSRGRGVAGVLEANFIKPTHDKQDFEKSTLYFRLETRLKEMALEYWDFHCHLVGYPVKKSNTPTPAQSCIPTNQPICSAKSTANRTAFPNSDVTGRQVVTGFHCTPVPASTGLMDKRRRDDHTILPGSIKKQARLDVVGAPCPESTCIQVGQEVRQNRKEIVLMMQENRRLQLECMELQKMEAEFTIKVEVLKSELERANHDYVQLVTELRMLDR